MSQLRLGLPNYVGTYVRAWSSDHQHGVSQNEIVCAAITDD
jgi:hypothetical protein